MTTVLTYADTRCTERKGRSYHPATSIDPSTACNLADLGQYQSGSARSVAPLSYQKHFRFSLNACINFEGMFLFSYTHTSNILTKNQVVSTEYRVPQLRRMCSGQVVPGNCQ